MLASAGPLPAELSATAAEPKWDGARCIVEIDGTSEPRLRMVSRSGRTVTSCFPELGPLTAVFAGRSAVLDGELIVMGREGRPDFYALSRRMTASKTPTVLRLSREIPATFMAFDALWLDGELLTSLPYAERRRRLVEENLAGPAWQTTPSYVGAAGDLLAACSLLQLEGLVGYLNSCGGQRLRGHRVGQWTIRALRVGSPYVGRACRCSSWTSPRPCAPSTRPAWAPGRTAGRRRSDLGSRTGGRSCSATTGAMTTD